MFGRKKKEETQEAAQYNPFTDNDSNFPLPSQEQEQQPQQQPQSFSQPTQSFNREQPRFPQQQFQQQEQQPQTNVTANRSIQQKKAQGHFRIIGGELVENGFRYIILSDMCLKIGDELDWID